MKPPAELWRGTYGIVVGDAEGGFLLDRQEQIVAALNEAEIATLQQTGELPAGHSPHLCVPEGAKLVDVARSYRAGRAMGVVDDSGRLVGLLGAEQILARIANLPSPGETP